MYGQTGLTHAAGSGGGAALRRLNRRVAMVLNGMDAHVHATELELPIATIAMGTPIIALGTSNIAMWNQLIATCDAHSLG